ncbi:MAG: asparagine synthase (glutamine-hydrolyzing) [Thermodesulfobacteriota bacterium]|nr:asparagine synthase (glutamine-hydrolyzing) [Thermodesulfobacteriota bacterium]
MCGICGIISQTLPTNEIARRLTVMGKTQRHRGPDAQRENVFTTSGMNVGLGLVRLSILDLETGMQPIVCESDGTAIVCNGQVYNYVELKPEVADAPFISRGDIEVAMHLYRKRGVDFLDALNGMYAGAIFDPRAGRVLLFRDRFGIKPLYYTEQDGDFFFSSEIRPLLAAGNRPAGLNEAALPTFFTYRYLPGAATMFEGIYRLPPGSFLEYDLRCRTHRIRRYWEYRPWQETAHMSDAAAEDAFYELFSDAVRIRLRSDVEVGSLLSGGIDSSAVASATAAEKKKVKLFTMAFNEAKYNELPDVERFIAARADRFAHCEHITRSCGIETLETLPDIVTSLEEPLSLAAVLPTDQVCSLAGSHVKVVLTGEGADEVFAGYRKFLLEDAALRYPDLDAAGRAGLDALYPELSAYMAKRHHDPVARYIQSEMLFESADLAALLGAGRGDASFPEDAVPALNPAAHPVNTAIAIESRARLPDYVILRLDKLSMRHSLETRTPFLDYRLAEFAGGLPVHLKVDSRQAQSKIICRRALARHNVIDHETAFRKKQPFTSPIADWLSVPQSLPGFLQDILFGDVVRRHGVLNEKAFKQRVNMVSHNNVGPDTLVSEADRVFAVIMFTLWYEIFKYSGGQQWDRQHQSGKS